MTTPATTRNCADCEGSFLAPFARFCPGCTHKSANRKGKPSLYAWTLERDAVLRANYDGNVKGRAARIARSFGWPKWVINKRAAVLGLTLPVDRKPWTPEEHRFLVDHLGSYTPTWIARKLGRTLTAVVMHAKYHGLSVAKDDGCYSSRQVAEGFGIDSHVVARWIRDGWLRAKQRVSNGGPHQAWRIKPEAVKNFIRSHPLAFDIRKVDQVWFLDVIGVTSRALEVAA